MDAHDIRFLEHALALARKGAGLASPNPMVGCLIVRDAEIVGEGFHQYDWKDHAEIVALKRPAKRPAAQPCTSISSLAITPDALVPAVKRL